jgi:hypothetical protein
MRLHAWLPRLVPALLTAAFAVASAIALGIPAPKEEPPPGFVTAINCPPSATGGGGPGC